MGRLSKVWTTVEKASNSHFEQVEVSMPEILTNLDQTVTLLGQAFKSILYTRRFNALKKTTVDPRKTKKLLKEKKQISVKKAQILLVKDLSLMSLELQKANKNRRKFSRQ